jgi:hypothetical protein
VTYETAGAHSVTLHNVAFQAQLMGRARDAILENRFPDYLKRFFYDYFGERGCVGFHIGGDLCLTSVNRSYPRWCVDALRSVGVDLLDGLGKNMSVIDGNGAKWEYSDVKA